MSEEGDPAGKAVEEQLLPGGTALGPITLPHLPLSSVDEPTRADQTVPSTYHVVVRGENFWMIAADHLSHRFGRPASTSEVARYWVRVVELNAETIRSGDPDLIYPDEVVELPPVE